ncbi:MAG: hypothetical protein JST11_09695 [Acidobacteria bacterium]|nr:hypothetical protein [Acidobacteriota bacterium]
MKKFWLSAIIGAAMLVPAGYAQTAPAPDHKEGKVRQREENQQKRVAQGVASGQLTPKETARIEHNEAGINKEVRRDRKANGGKLTAQEKAKINRQQNRESRQIYRQKHDAQVVK